MKNTCLAGFAWLWFAACPVIQAAASPQLMSSGPQSDDSALLTTVGPGLRQGIIDGGSQAPPGQAEIQLGAFRDRTSAAQAWGKIAARLGPPLNQLQPRIVPVDLPGKGRFWRLRLDFRNVADARAVCAALKDRDLACILARG